MEKKLDKELRSVLQVGKPCLDKSSILESLLTDEELIFHWSGLSSSIDDEEANKELFGMLVDSWLTIRGFSSAGTYVEYYKQCCKKSTKRP